jgi:hypothetical protein
MLPATMSRQTIAEYVRRATAGHGPRRAARAELARLDDVVRARRPLGLRPAVVSAVIPRVVAQYSKAAEEGMTDPQGRGRTRETGRRRGQHATRYTAPLAAYAVLLSSVQ